MFAFPSLTTSLDDIVFEGRNQAYGAYDLRQAYQRHLASAGAIALAGCLALLGAWAAWRTLHPAAATVATTTAGIIDLIKVEPQVVYQAKQEAKPAPRVGAPRPHAAVAAPRAGAMPTQVAKEDDPLAKPIAQSTAVDGNPNAKPNANASEAADVPTGPPGKEVSTEITEAPAATPLPFAEKMPEFEGGAEALMRYLRKHLRYPSRALAAGVSGRVYLSFVVQADGTISEVSTLKGLGYGLDEEAMRVVRGMPAWTPGQQNKHAVPVRFNLPITFQVE